MTPDLSRFVVLSGCSGGGKSTLLRELCGRVNAVVEEPGRRVIAEQLAQGGTALPWIDMEAFARRALEMSMDDLARCAHVDGWVFLDRGLIDAAVAVAHATGERVDALVPATVKFHRTVFLAPPWPEIYAVDTDRRHGLPEAIEEFDRLVAAYRCLGYEIDYLPRVSVGARADHVLGRLRGG